MASDRARRRLRGPSRNSIDSRVPIVARVLIVGANRGIGLELCRQLAARKDEVVATSRRSSKELEAIAGVDVREGIDVRDPQVIAELARAVGARSIDWLVVVSGILESMGLEDFDREGVREHFEVNALGVVATAVELLPCIKRGGKIGLLTSRMGSIADNTSGGSYAYRMSKAALNAAGRSLSIDLESRGISVAILHPGWVRTDMTHQRGLIDADEAAKGLIARLDELTLETSGAFLHQSGEELPW